MCVRERESKGGKGATGGPQARPRSDRTFAVELGEIVKTIGAKKFADLSAQERHYYVSLRIRKRIMLWLKWHEGETFGSHKDINIAAANEAYCSQVTSGRWIEQFTFDGMPWEIVPLEDGDYKIVARGGRE